MSEEQVYWVIREGTVKGKGRYVGKEPGHADFTPHRREAYMYNTRPSATWGRVVKVTVKPVRKPPVVEVRDAALYINGVYVAMQSQKGSELSVPGVFELAERIREALGI